MKFIRVNFLKNFLSFLFNPYCNYIIITFEILFLLRILDVLILSYNHSAGYHFTITDIFIGSIIDFSLFSLLGLIFLLPSFFIYKWKPFYLNTISLLFGIIWSLTSIFFSYYSAFTEMLPDSLLFKYNSYNTQELMSTYRYLVIPIMVFFIVFIFAILFSYKFINTQILKKKTIIIFYILVLIFSIVPFKSKIMSTIPNKSLIIENKVAFFIYSSYQYFTQTELDNLANEINNFIKKEYYNDHFLSNEYPLFRERVNNDVLSNYFEPFDQKPNLVFIIIESLGRNYSGPDALYGSFTPFLDSLAQHSLYWYNFLSTAGRTFGALPSIFASTPYGEMGFNELADSFPTHTSLLRNLKHNGYFISFFYGGWLGFDRMSDFLLYNKTDYLIKYFPPIYKKMGKDFSWGYDDRTLFNYSFKVIDSFPTSPRADIYLTLSNHNPWEYAEIEKYEKKLDQYFAQHPDLYSKQTDFFDKKRFATVLYTDDVLREFFKAYKKRPEFENTIFIITGDHGLSYNINLALKKFHVPLIIYSPKLKKSAVFKGVCSHSDISPSIELLLKNKTSFNIPQWTCYIGKGLDTSKFFNMNCSYAFIWENKTYPDILSNYYYMHKDSLFTVSDNFLQRNIKNPNIEKELKHKQTIIASMHKILPKQNKILPQHSFSTAYRLPLYPNYKNNPFVKYYKKNDNFIINKNQEFIDVCTAELKHNFFNTIIVNGFIQIQSQLLKKITTKLVFETRDSLNRLISWQSIDFEIKEKETKNFNIHKYLIISRTSSFLPIYKINVYFWNQERSILSIKKMNLDIYIE